MLQNHDPGNLNDLIREFVHDLLVDLFHLPDHIFCKQVWLRGRFDFLFEFLQRDLFDFLVFQFTDALHGGIEFRQGCDDDLSNIQADLGFLFLVGFGDPLYPILFRLDHLLKTG